MAQIFHSPLRILPFKKKRLRSPSNVGASPVPRKKRFSYVTFTDVALFALVLYVIILWSSLESVSRSNPSNPNNYSNAWKSWTRCETLLLSSQQTLANITELDLSSCSLKHLPPEIKYATNLRKLDISNNPDLTTLPPELALCTKLDILFASSCPGMKTLPKVLGKTPITRLGWRSGSISSLDKDAIPLNLVHLILTNNKIVHLNDPEMFSKMKNVRKLMLSHNEIASISGVGIKAMENLELLRLGGNNLTYVPKELWSLPKMTWLTISGNPIENIPKLQSKAANININTLDPMNTFLGKGASGQVLTYLWKDKMVAVKFIHGVTSDGNAEDELAVYSAIEKGAMEEHRVVGCEGLLYGHEKPGVVMELLPEGMEDFAQPPTIKEVTEDRWNEDTKFGIVFILNALTDVSNALNYLHRKVGVAHGDVYAHNMKVNPSSGRLYLLDFGASYVTGPYAQEAEKLEVRAFGILVGELCVRLNETEAYYKEVLTHLRDRCMNTDVKKRMTFPEITDHLKELKTAYLKRM